jgi:hypothetical protein
LARHLEAQYKGFGFDLEVAYVGRRISRLMPPIASSNLISFESRLMLTALQFPAAFHFHNEGAGQETEGNRRQQS